jgi:hypothetical protein
MGLKHYLRDADNLRWIVFLAFAFLCFIGGGGARADVQSLLYLRPAAIACIVVLLLIPGKVDFRRVKVPLFLLAGLALIMAIQLIPLPPQIWTRLPGHERFAEIASVAGMAQPWRPISVSPDLTLNSLVALIIPLAALVGVATLRRERLYNLLPVIIAGALLSALLAVGQLTTGSGSSLYLYRITNDGAAVGLFANRNHNAVLMAMALPMLSLWAVLAHHHKARTTRAWIAVIVSLLLAPTIVVAGSRAGLILGTAGLVLGYLQLKRQNLPSLISRKSRWRKPLLWAPWIIGGTVIIAAVLLSRATALQRIVETGLDDPRVRDLPLFGRIIGDYFPFGSGFGSFDPIYRMYEPHSDLEPEYLNHAHNDLFELAITGGLPALLLLGAFLLWLGMTSWTAFKAKPAFSIGTAFGRLGAILILLLLLGSLVDYPVRTPIMSFIFAISCGWLCYLRNGPASASSTKDAKASQ